MKRRKFDKLINEGPLPCTGCGKCMKYCPKELMIPDFIRHYNNIISSGAVSESSRILNALPFEKQPQNCSHCKMCESLCPMKISIVKMMINLSDLVRNANI